MKVKVGLIGVSGYGSVHFRQLRALAERGLVELAGTVVINPEQVPNELAVLKEMGSTVFSSADDMFQKMAGKLDLICIPTGIPFHESMTVKALGSGANVLVEKPAAGSNAAVQHMIQAEKDAKGLFAAVGFQHIYAREVQFIKQYLVSGRLGKVRQIVCSGIWPRNDQYYSRNGWVGKLKAADGSPILDSPINNAFAHYLNLELFFAGDSFKRSAHAAAVEGSLYRARKTIETFDTCAVRFTTETGIPILTLLSHTAERNVDPLICIECEQGRFYWQLNGTWSISSQDGQVLYSGLVESPHNDMFRDVIGKTMDRSIFCCPLTVAAEHTNCIEMLTKKLVPAEISESVRRLPENGQLVLDNVEQVFADCRRKAALPSELGYQWR